MNEARRAFVTVGSRQVHYRHAGVGPPVVLAHESPRSSVSLLWLVRLLAHRNTVLVLDTPGYGSSDRLPLPEPAIEDYAEALAETLEALGLERCSVYGAYTGAAIVLELARRHPQRVAVAVLDGLPVFTDAESEELLARYLPPLEPRIDGAHLVEHWARYRDQFVFVPRYRRELAARRDTDMPSAANLHEGMMDILRAGRGYGLAYAAAFRYLAGPAVAELTVPTAILTRSNDVLEGHLERRRRSSPPTTARTCSARGTSCATRLLALVQPDGSRHPLGGAYGRGGAACLARRTAQERQHLSDRLPGGVRPSGEGAAAAPARFLDVRD